MLQAGSCAWVACWRAQDGLKRIGCCASCLGNQMPVHVRCNGDAGVPKLPGHHQERDTSLEGQAGIRMSKVMNSDVPQDACRFQTTPKGIPNGVFIHRLPVRARKHPGAFPAPDRCFGADRFDPVANDLHSGRRDINGPRLPRLRACDLVLADSAADGDTAVYGQRLWKHNLHQILCGSDRPSIFSEAPHPAAPGAMTEETVSVAARSPVSS